MSSAHLWILRAVLIAVSSQALVEQVPRHERLAAAQKVQDMYKHAFDSYMTHAFPADELRPLSCDGRLKRERGDLDAMLGNYSMTLIDALDSLIIFKRKTAFKVAVAHIVDSVSFDKDLEVSTFEVNIRILGGLLSGHQHAKKLLPNYKGGLLGQARDLGMRLLQAFNTPTGMPRSRVNLQKGLTGGSTTVTIAEAGSFLLEFGTLSRLTGDMRFYDAAKRSLLYFWGKRNALDLVGTSIDVNSGNFVDLQSTTGPGQDSFFEYLLKAYMLFDDVELLDIFLTAYASVEQHHSFEGFTYTVDMNKGLMANTHLSPLACVWATLQVLVGDVAGALRSVLYWYGLWKKHEALPEVFDTRAEIPTQAKDSPLRPELIEAVFYLSLALPDDAMVFEIVKSIASAVDKQSRVECGFAALGDVTSKRLDDRMDSFFLSETLVYLYLALAPPEDQEKALPWPLSSVVFTTEGHIFPLPSASTGGPFAHLPALFSGRTSKRSQDLYPAWSSSMPMSTCEALTPFERVAVQQRCRTKYLLTPSYQMQMNAETTRKCRPQKVVVLAWENKSLSTPLLSFEGMASSLGRPVVTLPLLHSHLGGKTAAGEAAKDMPADSSIGVCSQDVLSSCKGNSTSSVFDGLEREALPLAESLGLLRLDLEQSPGHMPHFAGATSLRLEPLRKIFAMRSLIRADPLNACSELIAPITEPKIFGGRIVVIERGSCLFVQKLLFAQAAGAAGVIMVNSELSDKRLQVMTCPNQERGAGQDVRIPATMISFDDGQLLLSRLEETRSGGRTLVGSMFSLH